MTVYWYWYHYQTNTGQQSVECDCTTIVKLLYFHYIITYNLQRKSISWESLSDISIDRRFTTQPQYCTNVSNQKLTSDLSHRYHVMFVIVSSLFSTELSASWLAEAASIRDNILNAKYWQLLLLFIERKNHTDWYQGWPVVAATYHHYDRVNCNDQFTSPVYWSLSPQ